MGKSPVGCFNIIACGKDSVDHQDSQATTDSKTSSDRRGWSFRKRSARHRILNNTVISEPASSVKKDPPVSADVNFLVHSDLVVPEKNPVIQCKEEKIELSAQQNSKLSDSAAAEVVDFRDDAILDESSIVIIQAAIRGFLVRRGLLKKKKVIKLQAVVRGYLVRRRAVGTLRCVQAIIKMQALVRARRASQLVLGDSEKESQGNEKHNSVPAILRSKGEAKSDGTHSYTSIEKLLSNGLARQLMESTPKSKSINIKCDPSKSDSSWKWLERWMAASSATASNTQTLESGSDAEHKEQGDLGVSEGKSFISVPPPCFPDPANSKSDLELLEKGKPLPQECERSILVPSDCSDLTSDKSFGVVSAKESINIDSIIGCVGDNIDLQASKSASPLSSHPELRNIVKSDLTCDVSEFTTMEIKETGSDLKVEAKSSPNENETMGEWEITGVKKNSFELPETEGKRFSRKASNPAFIAAHSKFEEMSSAPNGAKLDTPSSLDPEVEYSLDKVSVITVKPISSRNIVTLEDSISSNSFQIGGSECGTELSVSSTLDSPDRLEVGVDETEPEPEHSILMIDSSSGEKTVSETNGPLSICTLETDPMYANTDQLERGGSIDSVTGDLSHSNEGQVEKDASINPATGDLLHTNTGQMEKDASINPATGDLLHTNTDQVEKDASINPATGDLLHISADQGEKDECINSAIGQGEKGECINSAIGQGEKDECINSAIGQKGEYINSAIGQGEKDERIDLDSSKCDNSVFEVDSQQLEKPGEDPDILPLDQVSEVSNLVQKPSPDASPRSQITITESQTTPSSQVSFEPKKNKGEKNEPSLKNRSLSSGKKSPANPTQDSSPRTSLDRLSKEHKAGKRRNSSSSTKSDHVDQETKDSNSSNSVPSYMQATESARAKAISSISPRSSPDAHEKDVFMKKRYSFPTSNGRQDSPRIQRSLSQAQPNAKGNGTHSPQDRKWRR